MEERVIKYFSKLIIPKEYFTIYFPFPLICSHIFVIWGECQYVYHIAHIDESDM